MVSCTFDNVVKPFGATLPRLLFVAGRPQSVLLVEEGSVEAVTIVTRCDL